MKQPALRHVLVLVAAMAMVPVLFPDSSRAGDEQMKLPPARKIPGLTAEDKFPNGCVDCHINMADIKQDERISTLMARWNKGAETKLLEKAQAVAPAGVTLKGKHPQATSALEDIPNACKTCHGGKSSTAPPFAPLVHAIHLVGGEDNHFLTIFQGECTHCHKLNLATGVWTVPSGREK